MGPLSYMQSVTDRNVVMRRTTVVTTMLKYLSHCALYPRIEEIGTKCLFLTF